MLNGELREFPLLAVLQSLMASGRSGLLTLEAAPRGQVALHEGELRAARCLGTRGQAALELLCWGRGGRFRFEPAEVPTAPELSGSRDALLRALFTQQQRWEAAELGPIEELLRPWERGDGWDENALVSGREFRAVEGGLLGGLEFALQSGLPPGELLTLLQEWRAAERLRLPGDDLL